KEKEMAVEVAKEKGREEVKAETKIEAQEDWSMIRLPWLTCQGDLERILAVMEKAGCTSCAASIIIKTLIRKYQGKEAA
ncbi:MAG: hypothetical protein LUQ65_12725, partial [Candidatus Helarchaeota archaeon]|nr:hypothetical protein [Candidatus Helarchaeota archaeon]